MPGMDILNKLSPNFWGVTLAFLPVACGLVRKLAAQTSDQSIVSLLVLLRYLRCDFVTFMKEHRAAYQKGQQTGDYSTGVCHYYSLMSDVITAASGPFWHFVPMYQGVSRMECHHRWHEVLVKYLEARKEDHILEIGCGFGEMGRQVAKRVGATVTLNTMADEEITGGRERIKAAGLEHLCTMVQGDYHTLPFEANSFDKVFGVYTMKYSANIDALIAELARVLRPGGKLLSYEILVTDKYDSGDKMNRYYVENISSSTCMPPLWHARDFRRAAEKAGLVPVEEDDLCGPNIGSKQWYSCFERTGVFDLLMCNSIQRLTRLAEALWILPKGFSDWYENCIFHPTTDFVLAGRLGVVSGAVMMTWRKPVA